MTLAIHPADTPAVFADAALLARAAAGEVDAFRLIFERHAAAIRGYAAGRVGPDAADDVVSETFAEAWTARDRFDPTWCSARPWLYGIATNVVARHREREERWLRTNETRPADPTRGVAGPPTAYELDPELARAIGSLSPPLRDVLLLTALADLTIADAARALGTSTVAARVRLHRARRLVQAALARGAHDD